MSRRGSQRTPVGAGTASGALAAGAGAAVLVHPVAERVPRDAQPGRRARHIATGLSEGLHQVNTFGAPHRSLERDGLRGSAGRPGSRRRPLRQRQRFRRHQRVFREQCHPLDHVGELTHIARPRVPLKRHAGVRAEGLGGELVVGAGAGEEVLGEGDNVPRSLAQRRQPQAQHRQAVVEVLAEAALARGRRQILVGRRQDPDVHRLAPGAAEPPHHALLDDIEELGLEPLGQERDLVEKEGSAMGRLEEPRLGLPRVREGPALEAEELGLEQGLGDGRAVDLDEGAMCAGTGAVNHASKQTLARARLALNEDGREPPRVRLALQQPPDLRTDGLDSRTVADQLGQKVHETCILPAIGGSCSDFHHHYDRRATPTDLFIALQRLVLQWPPHRSAFWAIPH